MHPFSTGRSADGVVGVRATIVAVANWAQEQFVCFVELIVGHLRIKTNWAYGKLLIVIVGILFIVVCILGARTVSRLVCQSLLKLCVETISLLNWAWKLYAFTIHNTLTFRHYRNIFRALRQRCNVSGEIIAKYDRLAIICKFLGFPSLSINTCKTNILQAQHKP